MSSRGPQSGGKRCRGYQQLLIKWVWIWEMENCSVNPTKWSFWCLRHNMRLRLPFLLSNEEIQMEKEKKNVRSKGGGGRGRHTAHLPPDQREMGKETAISLNIRVLVSSLMLCDISVSPRYGSQHIKMRDGSECRITVWLCLRIVLKVSVR